jgi:hypothetical protein
MPSRAALLAACSSGLLAAATATLPPPAGFCVGDATQDQLRGSWYRACEPCTALTLRGCAALCHAKGYRLTGVEAGHECWCGSALNASAAWLPAARCAAPCTGQPMLSCGGTNAAWVWNTSAAMPVVPPPPHDFLDQVYCVKNPHRVHGGVPEWACVITGDEYHEVSVACSDCKSSDGATVMRY